MGCGANHLIAQGLSSPQARRASDAERLAAPLPFLLAGEMSHGAPTSDSFCDLMDCQTHERSDMKIEPFPAHGIFIRWGKFQIGAFGIPAILAIVVIALAELVVRFTVSW